MLIGFDADEVLISLLDTWVRLYNTDYDDDLTLDEITEWDMTLFVKPECGKRIYDYLDNPDLYDECELMERAQYAVQRLRDLGHLVVVVTAKHNPSKYNLLVRTGIVTENSHYIVNSKKWELDYLDVLVDDNADTIEKFKSTHPEKLAILFNWKHNEYKLPGYPWRANNLMEALGMIENYYYDLRLTTTIPGIGQDAPTVVNENGGKQSALPYRFDLIDPKTMFALANILHTGAEKYGEWNWRKLSRNDNINHALSHLFAALEGDDQDDHLGHALCRVMFALSLDLRPEPFVRSEAP